MPESFAVSCGGYTVEGTPNGLPAMYPALKANAKLFDEIELQEHGVCCVTVREDDSEWPFLVVAQNCSPSGAGFRPGVLLVSDRTLFVGAGERVLIYSLDPVRRLATETADFGFWGWRCCSDVVLMSAELELAAFDVAGGEKLWTTAVEPPWTYHVRGRTVDIDVMGERRVVIDLRTGRPAT